LVFFCGLAGSIWLWNAAHRDLRDIAQQRFERMFDGLEGQLRTRTEALEVALRASRTHAQEHDAHPFQADWDAYLSNLDFESVYPGVMAFSYVEVVSAAELPRYIERMRALYGREFKVFPPGQTDPYLILSYSSSFIGERRGAVGFNVASHAQRLAALELARDTGSLTSSPPVELFLAGAERKVLGIVVYVPVYNRPEKSLPDAAARRRAAIGYVASPVEATRFFGAILRNAGLGLEIPSKFGFEIRDSATNSVVLSQPLTAALGASERLRLSRHVGILGRDWSIDLDAPLAHYIEAERDRPQLVLLAGLAVTLLLATLIGSFGITTRRANQLASQMTSRLRQKQAELEAMNESSPLGILFVDPAGRPLYANPRMEQMVAAPSGHQVWDRLFGAESKSMLLGLWRDSASAGSVHEMPLELDDAGEATMWLHARTSLVRTSDGPVGYLITVEDVTAAREAAETLRRAKEQAEGASRAKSAFLANMSHEIRTPLNAVIGMTDLTLLTALTAEQRGYLSTVKASGLALLAVINDILDLSKIEADKLVLEARPFGLHELLESTTRMLALRAEEKGLDLLLEIDPATPRSLIADEARLRQVLLNLLSNAIKFTGEGEVALSVRRLDASAIELSVRDTGIGIPSEKRAEIFHPFSQADASITRRFGGTGLGLTISARLVQAMGGTLSLESEVGKGTRFHFSLPAPLECTEVTAFEQLPQLDGEVLVITRAPATARMLESLLQRSGMRTWLAESHNDVHAQLQRAAKARFVLLDMLRSELSIEDWVRRLRPHVPIERLVLIVSGNVAGSLLDGVRTLGIGRLLTRPITARSLSHALSEEVPVGTLASEPTPSSATSRRRLHILLVEDNPVNQRLASTVLSKLGHTCEIADNGQEAVEAVARGRFDAVLMDLQMPRMGGVEACRAIREREREAGTPRVPIAAMTADAFAEVREECLEAGMDDYISKPFQMHQLENVLERLGQPAIESL